MQIRERTLYDIDVAMGELDKALLFAEEHKSAMGMVRAIEIRCKLNGMLQDTTRLEIKHVDIGSAIQDARARAGVTRHIDVQSVSVPIAELSEPSHHARSHEGDDLFLD